MTSDADLRRAYGRATESGAGPGHPDEAAWERLFTDEASPDERERLMAHVVACGPCTEIYKALDIVRREAAAFDSGAPRAPIAELPEDFLGPWARGLGPGGAARRWVAYVAVAAAIVAAVAVGWTWRSRQAGSSPAPPAATSAPRLGDHPAFRLDKPPVILSAALVLTPRGED